MNFLKELNDNKYLTEMDDNSALPEQSIKDLQKLIRSGADNSGKWSNALELVHKSYSVSSIERPTPSMKSAWKQYETLISYAVQQLSKYHGQKGTWRMTSESFTEKSLYEVVYSNQSSVESCQVEADSIKDIINFFNCEDKKYDIKEFSLEDGSILIEFWERGIIKTNSKLEIRKIDNVT